MNNRTVLITGAAKRIGAAIARTVHEQGMNIVIHYNRSRLDAETLVGDLNGHRPDSALAVQADLADPDAAAKVINAAVAFNNRLDVLVNNASAFYPTPVGDFKQESWDELVNVNLKAPLFLSQAALPYLTKRKGCIINLTDIHASRPLKHHTIYSVSKAGLVMLTKSLARELGPDIRVNAVSPGAIIWPESMDEKTQKEILSRITLRSRGGAEDIANAVLYLIDNADYMTGQILTVDGGRSLYT